MRSDYKNILDELVRNEQLIEEIDGRYLLDYLKERKVINLQQSEKLREKGPRDCFSVKYTYDTYRIYSIISPPMTPYRETFEVYKFP